MTQPYMYTINKVDPQNRFMSVTYSREGYPNVFQNFNPTDFSRPYLIELIRNKYPVVEEIWNWMDNNLSTTVENGESGIGEYPIQEIPQPEYNPIFQRVEPDIEIIDNIQYRKWNIVDLTTAEKIANITTYFQKIMEDRLNSFAQSRGYDNIISASTYINSPITKYDTEARRCIELRSLLWDTGYVILEEIVTGVRQIPTSLEEIESELPELTWEDN